MLRTKGQTGSQKPENNWCAFCAVVCAVSERKGEKLQTQSIAENVNVSARMSAQKQMPREEDCRKMANKFSEIE